MDQGILLAFVTPTASVLVGMLVNNRQLDSLRSELSAKIDRVDGRIDNLRGEMGANFDRVDGRIASLRNEMNVRFENQTQGLLRVEQVLDARLQHIEDRYR